MPFVPRRPRSRPPVPPGGSAPHRATRWVAAVAAPALTLTLLAPAAHAIPSAGHGAGHGHGPDHGAGATVSEKTARQTLPAGDGWASAEGGTTGGSAAAEIVDVRTRDELVAAVSGDQPKIVRVVADIDANTDAVGDPITCEDYARDGYSLDAYLDAFDPAHWTGAASGPLETARKASQAAQRAQISVGIGANTTLIGAGDVTLTGFTVGISNVDNVIVRNLRISDAYDCFPGWNGDTWKTEWDNLVVSGSTHVWLDHLTLDDGATVDGEQPEYFGEKFLRHDGLLDVVRAADLVTISWNRLVGHDKSMLFGNGDTATADRGRLRVTVHHNELVDLAQRGPRVRFGQVHVYDNTYRVTDPGHYHYSWGVGVESSIIARENTFHLADGVDPGTIVGDFGGDAIDAAGTWVNGAEVDVLAAYNAAHPDATLGGEVTGEAGPHGVIQPADVAAKAVAEGAGHGRLHRWQDPTDPTVAGTALLKRLGASPARTADGPVWSPVATGFAAVPTPEQPRGTTGGAGGRTVTVRTAEDLAAQAGSEGPLTILVAGTVEIGDGDMIKVSSDKTVAGAATGGELVDGGLFLDRVSNVVVRNLTFRDSFVAGDWDGKFADNDNDGIRVDTSSHVWIDHNEFTRVGDGQVDVRKDSTNVTASWNVFRDHNKTLGVGWTKNYVTTITLHHNRFSNVHQRNASLDHVAAGHVYNNWLEGVSSYGMSAGGEETKLVVESNVFEHARNPLMGAGQVDQRDNVFRDVWGNEPVADDGPTFDVADHYAHRADDVDHVKGLLSLWAGPRGLSRDDLPSRTITVAQDGTGDVLSVHAAVGLAARAPYPVEIVVGPGTYREVVSIWPDADRLTIRGASGDPADVVITYDKPDTDWLDTPTLNVYADRVTLQDLTIRNSYDGSAGPSAAYALRDAGKRLDLRDVVVLGDTIEGKPL